LNADDNAFRNAAELPVASLRRRAEHGERLVRGAAVLGQEDAFGLLDRWQRSKQCTQVVDLLLAGGEVRVPVSSPGWNVAIAISGVRGDRPGHVLTRRLGARSSFCDKGVSGDCDSTTSIRVVTAIMTRPCRRGASQRVSGRRW